MRRDWIAGLILLGLAIAYFIFADDIPRSQLSDVVGATSFPKLLAVSLAGLSVLLVATGLFGKRSALSAETQSKWAAKDLQGFIRAGGTLALGFGFLLIIEWVGYAVAVALLLAAMLLYNHMKLGWRMAVFAAAGGGFFWLLFGLLFDAAVPVGIWPKLFGI